MLLVEHVTKDGALAGPRVLEHMVTQLYFESESSSRFRLIRAVKNRFGAVNEMGIFAMTEQGLRGHQSICDFSFTRWRAAPGSVVLLPVGTDRYWLKSALVDQTTSVTETACSGSDNARYVVGYLASTRWPIVHDQDVFVNVVGGVRLRKPRRLGRGCSHRFTFRDRPIASRPSSLGVGSGGEVRPVPYGEERLREAAKHGFTELAPSTNIPKRPISGLRLLRWIRSSADRRTLARRFGSIFPVRTEPRKLEESEPFTALSRPNDLDGVASDTRNTLNWHAQIRE